MKALVTGASSGIGRDIARYLSTLGYDLVIVARRENLLEELKKDLKPNVEIEVVDVSQKETCVKLFEKHKDIDLLVKNASYLLGLAINCALQPTLSPKELYGIMQI